MLTELIPFYRYNREVTSNSQSLKIQRLYLKTFWALRYVFPNNKLNTNLEKISCRMGLFKVFLKNLREKILA